MALITPTADLGLIYTTQLVQGAPATVGDLRLSASGDVALVTGEARLRQAIGWELAIPVGAHFVLPQRGNQFYSAIGRPTSLDDETYLSMAEAMEATFLQTQAVAAAAGWLDLSEQVLSFVATTINRSTPGVVSLGVTVQTRAGATLTVNQPFTD